MKLQFILINIKNLFSETQNLIYPNRVFYGSRKIEINDQKILRPLYIIKIVQNSKLKIHPLFFDTSIQYGRNLKFLSYDFYFEIKIYFLKNPARKILLDMFYDNFRNLSVEQPLVDETHNIPIKIVFRDDDESYEFIILKELNYFWNQQNIICKIEFFIKVFLQSPLRYEIMNVKLDFVKGTEIKNFGTRLNLKGK